VHAPPCSSGLGEANCNACMPDMRCKVAPAVVGMPKLSVSGACQHLHRAASTTPACAGPSATVALLHMAMVVS